MSASKTPLWTAAELAGAVNGAVGGALPDITGVSIDSRGIQPGDIFVALNGLNRDGHEFVAAAFQQGAAAAIVTHDPGNLPAGAALVMVGDTQLALEQLADEARQRGHARIAAVTGSVGKTGTKEMLALALGTQGTTHRSLGSFNNQWGVPLSLARMPRESAYGVFEIGMNHAGEIAKLTRLVRPDVAIITTVELAHLEFFSGIEDIADAKAEIFLGMSGQSTAVLNHDNPMFERLAAAATERGIQHIASFGRHDDSTAQLRDLTLEADGSVVQLHLNGRDVHYRLGQPGLHLVMNSLAVLAAVEALGADVAHAADALSAFQNIAGRGQRLPIVVAGGTAILIDESYNASPASMRAAFGVLGRSEPGAGGRRIAVLGDMRELGTSGPELHRSLAQTLLAANIDQVFACGPLMRGLYDALPSGLRGAWEHDAKALLPSVVAALKPGDVVMVKGSLGSRMADIVKPLTVGEVAAVKHKEAAPC